MKDVEIVKDIKGNDIVKINNIIFRGKQNIDWKAVECYLRKYIGEVVEVANEKVYLTRDFTDEYAHSEYTIRLKGGYAKAKANISQAIIELLQTAKFKTKMVNKKVKHSIDAKLGWKYYSVKFAIPVMDGKQCVISYSVYSALMVVRHSSNGKLYLYDLEKIKKETSTPPWT